MKDEELEAIFTRETTPKPSADAKRAAIQAAMSEFSAAQVEKKQASSQGLSIYVRLTIGINNFITNSGRVFMNIFNQRMIVGGIATSCAVLLGFLVVLQSREVSEFKQVNQAVVDGSNESIGSLMLEERTNARTEKDDFEVAAVEEVVAQGARAALIGASEAKRKPKRDVFLSSDVSLLPSISSADRLSGRVDGQLKKEIRSMPAKASPQKTAYADSLNAPVRAEGRDRFQTIAENPLKLVQSEPVSTFSVDVDTASYSFVRRQLNQGRLPQKAAVRTEEMLNYFDYDYPSPKDRSAPFTTSVMVVDSPWGLQSTASGKKLIHIGIKGYDFEIKDAPKTNLVFLLDVSGSMSSPDKLPLVKQSMHLLLSKLQPEDTVAIAVYAGAAGTVLEPTAVKEKQKIITALEQLSAGGSTAGAEGIKLAYQLAEANFDKDAINRVILATDGDFNVGISDDTQLQGFVERKRNKGIYLSVLGFGEGNYNDKMMQTLAQNGNGVAAYIDTLSEAQKVLVNEATSALFPIAKDVKIQVEFNPNTVSEYRLVGYETRRLQKEDFNNDAVDAGDIGAGHTVTAIYEVTPTDSSESLIDSSRYIDEAPPAATNASEYGFVKLRYKLPNENESTLLTMPILIKQTLLDERLVKEVKFATAVAGFSQLLKGGKYTGNLTYDDVLTMAQNNKGTDEYGYRTEFVQLVRKASMASEL